MHLLDHTGHLIATTLATLRASLGESLAGVKAGEAVDVTEHGRPRAHAFASLDARLREAALLEAFTVLPASA